MFSLQIWTTFNKLPSAYFLLLRLILQTTASTLAQRLCGRNMFRAQTRLRDGRRLESECVASLFSSTVCECEFRQGQFPNTYDVTFCRDDSDSALSSLCFATG